MPWWPGSSDESREQRKERIYQEQLEREKRILEQKQKRAARDKARYEAKKAAGEHPNRPGRPSEPPAGPNEAAVIEYLRRHPDATARDVAFHAIYGGGTTAWEGLHRKTRQNATAEAGRVLKRLQNKGVVRQSSWTGGGKPKYDITDSAPEPDYEKLSKWIKGFRAPKKEKEEEEDKGGIGFFKAAGKSGGSKPSDSGGGKSYGVFNAPGESKGGDDDNNGPRDGKLY